MADQLMTVSMDATRVLSAFEKLGSRAQAFCNSAAYQTALAVKAAGQAAMPKRNPSVSNYTYQNVIIQPRQIGGYVVMMGDMVGEKESARRQRLGMKNARRTYHQDLHVGLWLEFGTRRSGRRPWLFPSANAQEGPHLRRMAESLDRAISEADL